MSAVEQEVVAEAKAKSKTEYDTVTMTDGRVVQFPKKRDLIKSYYPDEVNATVRVVLDFKNGETREFYPQPGLLLQFAGHGAVQKLGDELADPKLTDIDDKVAAIDRLIEQLNTGEWSARREGDSMAGTSVLARALFEKSAGAKTMEDIKAWLKSKKQDEKMALRGHPSLKPIIERIEAEKNAKLAKVDTDSLLAELG